MDAVEGVDGVEWRPDARTADGRAPAFSVGALSVLSGVPASTLRRWADLGSLPADMTARGAVRRRVVFPADVVERARQQGLFVGGVRAVPSLDMRSPVMSQAEDQQGSGPGLTRRADVVEMSRAQLDTGLSASGPGREASGGVVEDWDLARWADRARIAELERELAEVKLAASLERCASLAAENQALRAALSALFTTGASRVDDQHRSS